MRPGLEHRERAVLESLDRWPWSEGGVVIGGYALAAYGRPRYSEDIDIVIPVSAARTVEAWLASQGFKQEKSSTPNPQNYDAKTHRFSKGEVTLDLLVGAVRDRDARVDISAEWISENPRRELLRTLTGKTMTAIPVARLEAIWLMKLQAGRDQDITDLFSVFGQQCSSADVRAEVRRHRSPTLSRKLEATIQKIRSSKLYEDSLSRLGLKRGASSATLWKRFGDFAESCVRD